MKTPLIPTVLVMGMMSLPVFAQANDPFASGPAKKPPMANPKTIEEGALFNLEVCYETFSLPLSEAAALRRLSLPDSELYKRIVKMVSEKEAKQERFSLVRTRPGQKSVSESISEVIYPTEYDPPELPNSVGAQIVAPPRNEAPADVPDVDALNGSLDLDQFSGLRTPSTPTAFETRNIGHTLEVEPMCTQDARTIDLRISPENVALVGEIVSGQGLSETRMPEFESQKLAAAVTVKAGLPHLLGTVSRPPNSKVDPDSATTTWFAFVTARPVLPE